MKRTDPEVLRGLMSSYHATLRSILERHGGTVEKFVGDAAMAVFGIPNVHEDDAVRVVVVRDKMQHGDQEHGDWLAQVDDVAHLGHGEQVAGVSQVGF